MKSVRGVGVNVRLKSELTIEPAVTVRCEEQFAG